MEAAFCERNTAACRSFGSRIIRRCPGRTKTQQPDHPACHTADPLSKYLAEAVPGMDPCIFSDFSGNGTSISMASFKAMAPSRRMVSIDGSTIFRNKSYPCRISSGLSAIKTGVHRTRLMQYYRLIPEKHKKAGGLLDEDIYKFMKKDRREPFQRFLMTGNGFFLTAKGTKAPFFMTPSSALPEHYWGFYQPLPPNISSISLPAMTPAVLVCF